MITETFNSLLRDRAHWEFEIFLMLIFDGLIAGLLFPSARKHWKHHIARDQQDEYNDFSSTPFVLPDRWAHLSVPDVVSEEGFDWSLCDPDHVPYEDTRCARTKTPPEWYCTRELGHEGLCAAIPKTTLLPKDYNPDPGGSVDMHKRTEACDHTVGGKSVVDRQGFCFKCGAWTNPAKTIDYPVT